MTDKQAFEAWFAENFEPHDRATTYGHVVVEDAWNAALAYLRSQGDPVAHLAPQGYDDEPIPVYLAPQPAIPDGWQLNVFTSTVCDLITAVQPATWGCELNEADRRLAVACIARVQKMLAAAPLPEDAA